MNEENQFQEAEIENDFDKEKLDRQHLCPVDDEYQASILKNELADLVVEKLLANTEIHRFLTRGRGNDRAERSNNYRGNDQRGDTRRSSDRRPLTFEDLVPRGESKLSLGPNYQFIEDYLQGLLIVNNELYEDFNPNDRFPIKHSSIKNKNGSDDFNLLDSLAPIAYDIIKREKGLIFTTHELELLYRIEKFMLVLAVKPLPAFIEEPKINDRIALDKKITSIGQEFIFLLSKHDIISKFDHEYLTTAVKIFDAFLSNRLDVQKRSTFFSLQHEISHQNIKELNELLFDLRQSWIQGRYDPVYKTTWKPQHGIQYRDFSEFTKKLKNLALKIEKDRARLAQYKMDNVAIYRFQIEILCNKQSVRHAFFGPFFTALIKAAKQSSDLVGLLDFICIWKEMDQEVLQADTVLFFDANKQTASKGSTNQFAFVEENFQKFADGLLKKEIEKLQGANAQEKQWEITVGQIPVLLHVSPERIWLLESNSPQWKTVNTQLIPYFYIMGSFEREYSDEISSRTSTGRRSSK